MPQRLLLPDSKSFPIQAFFNAVGDSSFVHVIDCLTKGIGFSINDVDCTFPSDLDPEDETFEGVRFSLFEDQITISNDELRDYLHTVCEAHVADHPEDQPALKEYVDRTALKHRK